MSKRVNISYLVDFDEIIEVVENILYMRYISSYQLLDEDFSNLTTLLTNGNVTKTIETLKEMRENLFKVDLCLNDCANILMGYQKEMLKSAKPKEGGADIESG